MSFTTIPFRKGFDLVPYEIDPLGIVTFTDGSRYSGITPNQRQCEAYGYTYDEAEGVCRAQAFTVGIAAPMENVNNTIQGNRNRLEAGINNTIVVGENNTLRGLSRNNIVVGNENEIANSVNNAFVYGTLGNATAPNSIVLGGNTTGDLLGQRQGIQLIYGRQTTNNSTQSSYLNNETGSFFVVPDDTIIYFHAETIAVRVGGSSGSGAVGDYGTWVERGVVINKSGTLSIQRERDTIKTSGTVTNWRILASTSGTDFLLTVRGQTDMTLEWICNVNITQLKTDNKF
tara:strand:- start:1547 stop:2407 length:861 start_codon:yes stop_codon:yes gene_type:complete